MDDDTVTYGIGYGAHKDIEDERYIFMSHLADLKTPLDPTATIDKIKEAKAICDLKDPSVLDVVAWKNRHSVSTGCIVYRNRVVGLTFFGPKWKGNSLNISIASDKEGMNYLKGILLNQKQMK